MASGSRTAALLLWMLPVGVAGTLLLPAERAPAGEAAAATAPAPSGPIPASDEKSFADGLSGRAIYARVLENRFDSYIQESTLDSGDRGGRVQALRLRMQWKDFRDERDRPDERGVLSKTLVKYLEPFDVRHSGYLIIHNHERANDQFVYFPSRRRVVRVNLRGEAVFGTDFSFEDVVPREVEDSTYRRVAHDQVQGEPVYVVEVTPRDFTNSEYSRFLVHVEKRRFVPLRVQYWDEAGVLVKELEIDETRIERHEEIWVPMKLTMRNLLHESYTTLEVEELEPNPTLGESDFDLRRLESH